MSPRATTIWTREEAYRYCQRLARTHYENFTVGSWLLPREQRRHVYAIYGYCRGVDDLGDENTPSPLMGEGWDGGVIPLTSVLSLKGRGGLAVLVASSPRSSTPRQ